MVLLILLDHKNNFIWNHVGYCEMNHSQVVPHQSKLSICKTDWVLGHAVSHLQQNVNIYCQRYIVVTFMSSGSSVLCVNVVRLCEVDKGQDGML